MGRKNDFKFACAMEKKGAHAWNCYTAKKLMDLKNDSDTCRRKSFTGNLPMSQQKFQEVIHGEFPILGKIFDT